MKRHNHLSMAWVIDLDGVIWLGRTPIDGSAEAVARLRDAGERVVFVTNNSEALLGDQEAKLAEAGIEAEGDVVTSALAAASMLEPGSSALVCGGPGVVEALERRGVTVRREGGADAVVVGYHRNFDYESLRAAHRAVFDGARLVGTNADPTLPTPDGPVPGSGSILAAVATAAGVEPEVAGKPHQPMIDLVRDMVGKGDHIVIGDRPTTDGKLAAGLGARFGLVLSGASGEEDLADHDPPHRIADDLAAMVAAELGSD